jgi:chemotaxis methyl-accepting protein methylase
MSKIDDMMNTEGMEEFEKLVKKFRKTPEEKRIEKFICKMIIDAYEIGYNDAEEKLI